MKIRYADMFCGIGGFRLALNSVPSECVFSSDYDKNAQICYQALHGELPYTEDIRKYNYYDIPDIDLLCGGFPCFTGDTLVTTDNGLVTIRDIKSGDKVLTHDGTYKTVSAVLEQGEKEIWNVDAMATEGLRTTENHLFYVRKKYKEGHKSVRKFTNPTWVECKNLTKEHYMGFPVNDKNNEPCTSEYTNIDLSEETIWYLAGRYLGDGWIRARKDRSTGIGGVIVCCGKHKSDKFETIIGEKYHYTKVEEKTVNKYIFSNVEMAKFFAKMGKGAENKFIPQEFIDLNPKYLSKIVEGYLDSDGYFTKQGKYRITTISRKLAYTFSQVVAKVYCRPTSIYFRENAKTRVIEGRTVNCRPFYIVEFKKEASSWDKAFYEKGYIWFPIKKVEKMNVREFVYDITVEENHSFIANNCIAHNCCKFSMAGDRMGFASQDPRAQMFWELAKILEIKKPTMFWFENVKGLLNHDEGNSFKSILRKLDELGYDVEWFCPNAKDTGYPIIRERVFIVGHFREKPTKEIFPIETKSFTYDRNIKVYQYRRKRFRITKGYVPTLTASMGTGGNNVPMVITDSKLRKLTPRECFRLQGMNDSDIDKLINTGLSNSALYERAGRTIFQPIAKNIAKKIYNSLNNL